MDNAYLTGNAPYTNIRVNFKTKISTENEQDF